MVQTLRKYFAFLARSRISLLGMLIMTGGFLGDAILLWLSWARHNENPFLPFFAFAVLPGVVAGGLALIGVGVFFTARSANGGQVTFKSVQDLAAGTSREALTRLAILVLPLTFVGATFFGVAGLELHHYTDSTMFCGQVCHNVMSPELTAYENSPHSSVPCVDCHIGPGVSWFVKSKISGTAQLFAVAFDTYPRPILTPVENLRPARDTCEICHRPQQFHGNLLKVLQYFSEDEQNTLQYTILNLRVGGEANPDGPPTGIHWHVSPDTSVRYQYADRERQYVVRVTMTDSDGNETTWARDDAGNAVVHGEHMMDCIDCHNRPTHIYPQAEEALDERLAVGEIDPSIPWIKKEALEVLEINYPSDEEADLGLEELIVRYRENRPNVYDEHKEGIEHAVEVLKRVWHRSVHPKMNIRWGTYLSNLGHPGGSGGCLRCHNEELRTPEGESIDDDCDLCHFVLAVDNADPDVFRCLHVERSVKLW